MTRPILLYLLLWVVAFVLKEHKKDPRFILLPYAVFMSNELVYAATGVELVRAKDRTGLFYDLSTIPTKYNGVHSNYSEGYYPDKNYGISCTEAEENKFRKILELLGSKQGDLILDLGSGMCPFGIYGKERGIQVIGMTLSEEQKEYCAQKGTQAIVWDFERLYEPLVGKVDHVLIMGSSEHIWGGSPLLEESYVHKAKRMETIFRHCQKYLKGPKGKIFVSSLHLNPAFRTTFGTWVLERAHGGTFQMNSPELDIFASAKRAGLKTVFHRDATEDYYMATVSHEDHFGHPSEMIGPTSAGLLILTGIYPPAIWIWIYAMFGYWMWMFDGKVHTNRKDYQLLPEDQRPCTLWWGVFQANC